MRSFNVLSAPALTAAVLVGGLALAACGGDNGDATATTAAAPTTTSAEGCVTRPFYLAFAASETLP